MPLGHIGMNVPDLLAAQRYYDQLMPALGYEAFPLHPHPDGVFDQFAYRPAGGKIGTFLFFYPAADPGPGHVEGSGRAPVAPGLQHMAFIVANRGLVRAAHQLAEELDSTIVHEPRAFPEYPPPYYATFWLDPFGVMLEACCHHDRD